MELFKMYKRSFEGLNKDVWSVALIYLINRSGEMVIPFLTLYLTDQLGFTKTQSAIVLVSFGVGALLGSNIGGILTDRIGNFKVMAISLGGTGVAFMSILLFHSFVGICLILMITGLFSSMFSPAAFSAVSLWGRPENTTRGYSLLRMAINLGFSIGGAIGGLLAVSIGYRWLFILDGMTCFFAIIAMFMVLKHRIDFEPAKKESDESIQSPYRDVKLMLLLLFNLINMVAFFQIMSLVPLYFK